MYTDRNPPSSCPNGHRLGPYKVLVGWDNLRRPPLPVLDLPHLLGGRLRRRTGPAASNPSPRIVTDSAPPCREQAGTPGSSAYNDLRHHKRVRGRICDIHFDDDRSHQRSQRRTPRSYGVTADWPSDDPLLGNHDLRARRSRTNRQCLTPT